MEESLGSSSGSKRNHDAYNLNNAIQSDPLALSNSDHPGMNLTSVPFNGSNYLGWKRQIRMALGAKLKLGFIDGTCEKPEEGSPDAERWMRCDYMVTCWILHSMTAEMSNAFLYASSSRDLWIELSERYGQSNAPQIFQLQQEINGIAQGTMPISSYFVKLKRCWDEMDTLRAIPVCTCGKLKLCSCMILSKALEIENQNRLMQFLMNLNPE